MSKPRTRRAFIKTAAVGALATAATATIADGAAPAAIDAADPSAAAIAAYWRTNAAYEAACEGTCEAQMDALCHDENVAAAAALQTVPTTAAGLRAFCEFGAALARKEAAEQGALAEWFVSGTTAEAAFFATLETAARRLLPE